jgi:adenine phosphoribosyltransferase
LNPGDIKALIRTIPDFPAAGIQFRDITTLIAHGEGLAATIDHLVERAGQSDPAAVAGIEARGFIFGAAIAARLKLGFIPLRKAGKLPVETIGVDYELEYGAARIELDPGAIDPGERVLLVDDLNATGGTALAGVELLRQAGAVVDHALFVIDLPELGGAQALRSAGVAAEALVDFPGH